MPEHEHHQPAPTDGASGRFRADEQERERRVRVRRALAAEGFRWEPWQKPERGQVFGMIRSDGEMQVHVRYYRGGYVMAEHEIAHHYFEHLISPRDSAHDLVEEILARHGIDDVEVREKDFPERMQGDMPESRTPWRPVIATAGAVLLGALFGVRRFGPFGR